MRNDALAVQLRNRRGDVIALAVISPEDESRVAAYSWSMERRGGYAKAQVDGKCISLHSFIHQCDEDIDHKNRDRLDERRDNLRCVSRSENNRNKVKLKPSLRKDGRYCVGIGPKGASKQHMFRSKDAADAFCAEVLRSRRASIGGPDALSQQEKESLRVVACPTTSKSKTGVCGVIQRRNRFLAVTSKQEGRRYVGSFATIEEAAEALRKATE